MLIKVFEATVLLVFALVFTNIILNETKEEKEIARLFNRILIIAYIVNIVLVLSCSITTLAKENTKQENEIVIELKED